MNGPVDYLYTLGEAFSHRQLHARCHPDGTLDFIRAFDGLPPPTIEEVEAAWAALPPKPVTYDALSFLLRFTPEERAAIRNSQNPYVQDFIDLLRAAGTVSTGNPLTQQGMGLLVAEGLLTPERRDAILGA